MTKKTQVQHYCPSCGTALISEPAGTSLRCTSCKWYLIALAEWRELNPFAQGYVLYAQGAWPTSELADAKNPYAEDSPEWTAFQQGEQRAVLDAQDGEE